MFKIKSKKRETLTIKTEAEKTIQAFINKQEAKLKMFLAKQSIFLCGDFSPRTKLVLENVRIKLYSMGLSPIVLLPDDSNLPDFRKELITLNSASIISLIDGKKAGTWTETVLSIANKEICKKVLFFYDENRKNTKCVSNCRDYHVHFSIKHGYKSIPDLKEKIILFSHQRAWHNANLEFDTYENECGKSKIWRMVEETRRYINTMLYIYKTKYDYEPNWL